MNNITEIYRLGSDINYNYFLDNLKINDSYDVRDKSNKRLVYNELIINDSKLYIETNFNKIININNDNRKLCILLDNELHSFFEDLDNKVVLLLDELFENNDFLNLLGDFDSNNIQYNSIIKENNNTVKFKIDNDTEITYNNNNININDIKENDYIRMLLSIESINLYPNETICFLRFRIHLIDIYRYKTINLNSNYKLNNFKFTSDVHKFFKKITLDSEDISYIQTDVNEEDNSYIRNQLDNIDIIQEEETDEAEDKELDLEENTEIDLEENTKNTEIDLEENTKNTEVDLEENVLIDTNDKPVIHNLVEPKKGRGRRKKVQ
jgi:hypothetical protein